MLIKPSVVIISQYMEIKLACCIPLADGVMCFNHFSIKLEKIKKINDLCFREKKQKNKILPYLVLP